MPMCSGRVGLMTVDYLPLLLQSRFVLDETQHQKLTNESQFEDMFYRMRDKEDSCYSEMREPNGERGR